MKEYIVYQIDAFTREKFYANPAGVVVNADGLSDDLMQKIARELNNSETAFVFKNPNNNFSHEVRFFTPSTEVPVCSHATIATHYALALEKNISQNTIFEQKCKAGVFDVEVKIEDDNYFMTMTYDEIEFLNKLNQKEIEILTKALGLKEEDLIKELPIQVVSTGHSKVLIAIKDYHVLNALKPNMQELAKLSECIDCNGYFVFTFDTKEENILTQGRMFAPAIGINEDPVTGNAHAPLAPFLHKYKFSNIKDTFSFYAKQGKAIGREGKILVEFFPKEDKVKITGEAVVVFKTKLFI
ncbi:PhzF family phenazine biosynthesis isomerase [Campylobacter sp. 1569]|uniref:PhzF family phenazine biosynthesis isomerase n=1 Tax=Campylobacter sp. 1569 TaxID=2735746 RepID=UPI00301C68AD|nr:PhzF family phenazine biosynthesis isomerase [Campylobacter sp. 1569]